MTVHATGGCLCGAIRYEVTEPVTTLRVCHCTDCQKATGTGMSVNVVMPSAALRLLQGKPKSFAKKADSGRTLVRWFCGDCGSPLYSYRENTPERIVLRAGTLDDSSGAKVTSHIWTKSARPWSLFEPGIEKIPGNPA